MSYPARQLSKRYTVAVALSLVAFVSSSQAAEYKVSVVAEGLDFPWSLAFLPNGEMLVAERSGALRMIRDGELLEYSVRNVPPVYAAGQGGLFDVLIDPNFAENETIYLSFAGGNGSANALSVVSARLDGSTLYDVQTILTVEPTKNTPHHYGGRMAFLPDGTLLVTSGDGFDFREQAQSLSNTLGTVLRINTDGTIPPDNPFVARENAMPEIYSYGHRNPQGIAVAKDGTIWLHEHGPRGGDELNIVTAGENYGWPAITYGIDYSGAYVSPYQQAEGMRQPVIYWTPSIAPAGIAEYQGDAFPQWRGNLFVASLVEKSIRRLSIAAGAVTDQELMLTDLDLRFRDVRTGPEGNLYLLTDSEQGTIMMLAPE